MAHPRQSGMMNSQSRDPLPVYQQSVFSVPLKQQSVVPTPSVPLAGFAAPQTLRPGALQTSFQPVVPMSVCVAPQGTVPLHNLQLGSAFPYIYGAPVATGIQHISQKTSPVHDAQAVMEERKKFDKERQFQLQQQKLKQFSSSGIKTKLNSDKLIESMFGKTEKIVRSVGRVPAAQPNVPKEIAVKHEVKDDPTLESQNIVQPVPVTSSVTNHKKNLDHMMQQCSDLTGPQKARTFQKTVVKNVKMSEHFGLSSQPAFYTSERSRDWSCVQGLEEVFTLPRPRFPVWCSEEWVPSFYKKVEELATDNGEHEIETSRLYPILLSSGLPREVLGYIWNLVNTTTPGTLTKEELYAAIALIAVVQSGCMVSSIDILHSLPRPPLPVLPFQQVPSESIVASGTEGGGFNVPAVAQSMPAVQELSHEIKSTADDDEFGEFCSIVTSDAVPIQNSASSSSQSQNQSVLSNDSNEEEFEEFQQATITVKESNVPVEWTDPEFKKCSAVVQKDVITDSQTCSLSAEDKYAVFRKLEEECDGTSEEIEVNVMSNSYLSDEFGDFIHAEIHHQDVSPAKDDFNGFSTLPVAQRIEDFADFSFFQSTPEITTDFARESFQNGDDDAFGDFASSQNNGENLSVDYGLKPFQKDNLSLGETQSLCSLDLGQYSCDSLAFNSTVLSRQGSVPSLDLRTTALDDSENGNSEDVLSKTSQQSPPPAVEDDNSSLVLTSGKSFPTAAPLIDKYSFIRPETENIIVEDKLCNEWLKCLRSCNKLLQNANHIFEQMNNNQVMTEVLDTEEGQDYVKNMIEVYRVAERIHQSSAAVNRQNGDLCDVLAHVKEGWVHLMSFLVKTFLMPEQEYLDFSWAVPRTEGDGDLAVCGVCLLKVHLQSNVDQDKLTYGGQQYHSTCANLWVNCVDLLLPALTLPHLL